MQFQVNQPDREKSPYTGMTKKHWQEAGEFLLEGIFAHIQKEEDPILVPRHETTISYPRIHDPDRPGPLWREAAERFEGLARSFLIAAPVLQNHPDTVISGYLLKDYYKKQILLSVTEGTPQYLMSLPEIISSAKAYAVDGEEADKAFQHTCECASLVIGLWMCKEVIWDTYQQEEKDKIAAYLTQFGHSYTGHHNWRLFNMLILGFLYREGYEADTGMIRDHAAGILTYYAGDGWYRDGHFFDYYCGWAFHVYGPIWNLWYGYEKEPAIASKIEEYANRFVHTFPAFFDRESTVMMWGRSNIYRSAAAAPLASAFLLNNAPDHPGSARKIVSASLLHFITKEECFYEGVPCLGFYGPFAPLVQSYSCAASPFWMANSFVCLLLPDEHPFWQEKEDNGTWETLSDSRQTIYLEGPGLCMTQDGRSGSAWLRTGKVSAAKRHPYLNGYLRLGFQSHFPWDDFGYDGVESMQYSLQYDEAGEVLLPNLLMWAGEKDGVLYRKQYFDYSSTFQNQASIDLADFAVPCGIVRADRIRIPVKPYNLTMGGLSLPAAGKSYQTASSHCGQTQSMMVTGEYGTCALTAYYGFDDIAAAEHFAKNPVSEMSVLIYGKSRREKMYEYKDYCMISVILGKQENAEFTREELFPIEKIEFEDVQNCGGYGKICITLIDHTVKIIDFEGIEGRLTV